MNSESRNIILENIKNIKIKKFFQLQSGVLNEKEFARSLHKRRQLNNSIVKQKSKLKNTKINCKDNNKEKCKMKENLSKYVKKMEIQVGLKDLFVNKDISCHIENFISYILAVKDSSSLIQFTCITNLFLGCYFNSSRTLEIISYFKSLFYNEEVVEQQLETQSATINDIKKIISNFKEFRQCETARKLHKFVSYVLALGLCDINKLSFSIGKFEIFHVASEQRNLSFVDIIEMIFETVIYFVERGHQAFITGDPWQLLYGDNKLLEFEKRFSYVNSHIAIVESGDLDKLPISIDEFEAMVIDLKEEICMMLKDNPAGSYRQILVVKLNVIDKINIKIFQSRKNVSIREKPYSILLFGGSSVGKSTMTSIILNQLMQANGLAADIKKINSLNLSEQYQSDYDCNASCVIFDDLANATMQTSKGNHCQLILDFINNNPKFALKAGVEEKANCPIRPKLVVGTTNVKTLLAHQYSNEPFSIVRRFEVTITVKVKPEYCQPNSSMIDPSRVSPGFKDCWLFTIEKPVAVLRAEGAAVGIGYELVTYNNIKMENIGMKMLLEYLTNSSKIHFQQQKALVQASHDIFKVKICDSCQQYEEFCDCLHVQVKPIPNFKNMFSMPENKPIKNNIFVPEWVTSLNGLNDTIVSLYNNSKQIIDFVQHIEDYAGFENIYQFHTYIQKQYSILTYILIWPIIAIMCIFGCMVSSSYLFFFVILSIIKFLKGFNYLCELKLKAFALKENSLLLLRKYDTEKNRRLIKIGILGITSVVIIKKIYDLVRTYNILNFQGSECVTPEPMSDERPANQWKKPYKADVPKSNKSWTTTSSTLANMVSDNISYFEGTYDSGEGFFCCAFPLKSNVWLINNHAIRQNEEIKGKFIRHSPNMIGGNFNAVISPFLTVHIPNTDLAVVYIPTGGDNKDFTDYFPIEYKEGRIPSKLISKDKDAKLCIQHINAKFGIVGTPDIQVKGYEYKTEISTYKGLCMAALIADEIGPIILGFHFAGISGQKVGAATSVTQSQLKEACYILSQKPSVLLSHNTSDLLLLDLGPYKNVKLENEIHSHSPLNFQEEDAVFRAFGKHSGPRKTYKSEVEPTLISKDVEEIMGKPNIWGPPPNLKGWQTWQRDLSNMTHTKVLSPTLLVCAVKDYEKTINQSISQERLNRISPLSDVSALSGADGVYGIDSINMKSSAGAPINKPKNKVLYRSEIPVKGISQPIIAPEFIWEDVRRCEQALLRKERVYFQFTACLKDEPTKITKIKTRVFCGSPLSATILVRKYYLPFCKLIMENSEIFECAVGINAHGPEWDKLTKHIIKFGKDRMVAGDYANYDSTMPASITLASFKILINLAKRCGYSEDQIIIMEGLATEMCYPLYDYNGEYIEILGSNPSGHPLTVFINSIANSLYMRYAYYHIYPYNENETFQQFVALMTFGDDNMMSVSIEKPMFNHTKIAEVLAASDVTYTMADKTAESIPFISLDNVSFLKRSFIYSEELGGYIAPIEEASLFKTLHSAIKSKELTREQHSAQAIDCVLREWFFYGRQHFDEKRVQLNKIAKKHQLLHHFEDNELHTYDSLKSSYINKYLTKDINPESDPQVGESNVRFSSTLNN